MTSLIQNIVDALSLGSLYALLALGIALIFGIMRLLNFAHGQLIVIGAYSLWMLDGLPAAFQVLGAIAITILAALILELVAFRPLRRAEPAVLLVSSFAIAFLLQSLAIVVFGGRPKGVQLPAWLSDSINIGDVRIPVLSVVTVAAAALLLAGVHLVLTRTPIGIQMRAAAENFTTARLVGVRASKVISVAFAMSGLLAGVAAVLIVAKGGTVTAEMGTAPVLIAFIAVIIGGLGSLSGAVYGGYLLGALTVALQVLLPASALPYRDALLYLIVLFVLTIRPQGLIVLRSTIQRV